MVRQRQRQHPLEAAAAAAAQHPLRQMVRIVRVEVEMVDLTVE